MSRERTTRTRTTRASANGAADSKAAAATAEFPPDVEADTDTDMDTDPDPATGATIVLIYQTSTDTQEGIGKHKGYEYARGANPTRTALEPCLASLENGRFGLAFASGMAAEVAVLNLLSAGDHVIASNMVYGGTYRLFERVLRGYGLEFSWVDASDLGAIRRAFRPVVLLHLVARRAGPVFRPEPAALADVPGAERDHRDRALHQYGVVGQEPGHAGALARVPALRDAVLRVELRGPGERPGLHPDLFAALGRNLSVKVEVPAMPEMQLAS